MNRRGTPRNLRSPWKKGESGNRRGRPKAVWKEWLSQVDPEAQELLRKALRDKRVKMETRVRIAQDVLDRQHGRPRRCDRERIVASAVDIPDDPSVERLGADPSRLTGE